MSNVSHIPDDGALRVGIGASYKLALCGLRELRAGVHGARPIGLGVVIESTLAGSPAVAAGLRAGDRIIKVDDQELDGLSIEQVVALIVGRSGTTVSITIERIDPTGQFATLRLTVVRGVTATIRPAARSVRRKARECKRCPDMECAGCPRLYPAEEEFSGQTVGETRQTVGESDEMPEILRRLLERSREPQTASSGNPRRAIAFTSARAALSAASARQHDAPVEYDAALRNYQQASAALDRPEHLDGSGA